MFDAKYWSQRNQNNVEVVGGTPSHQLEVVMEFLNFDEYVRNNPTHKEIEFKVFAIENRYGLRFYIKFLGFVKRFFRNPLHQWITVCFADGHSQGFDWSTKYFTSKEDAEQFVGVLCQSYEESQVDHFMKCIR